MSLHEDDLVRARIVDLLELRSQRRLRDGVLVDLEHPAREHLENDLRRRWSRRRWRIRIRQLQIDRLPRQRDHQHEDDQEHEQDVDHRHHVRLVRERVLRGRAYAHSHYGVPPSRSGGGVDSRLSLATSDCVPGVWSVIMPATRTLFFAAMSNASRIFEYSRSRCAFTYSRKS